MTIRAAPLRAALAEPGRWLTGLAVAGLVGPGEKGSDPLLATGPLVLGALAALIVAALLRPDGGHYAIALMPWLALGWAGRFGAQEGAGSSSG